MPKQEMKSPEASDYLGVRESHRIHGSLEVHDSVEVHDTLRISRLDLTLICVAFVDEASNSYSCFLIPSIFSCFIFLMVFDPSTVVEKQLRCVNMIRESLNIATFKEGVDKNRVNRSDSIAQLSINGQITKYIHHSPYIMLFIYVVSSFHLMIVYSFNNFRLMLCF